MMCRRRLSAVLPVLVFGRTARLWAWLLQSIIFEQSTRPHKLAVLPLGGPGRAERVPLAQVAIVGQDVLAPLQLWPHNFS